jgi:hypothetical protein
VKIFISWSGDESKDIALILKEWIPSVIQVAEPYVSSEDIDKGARWASDISKELDDSSFGIICLTKSNLNAPWINFEAGALGKKVADGMVCPFLYKIKPSEISGPILQFQSTNSDHRDDVFKLIKSINLTKHHKHQNEFNQQLAQEIVKSGLKQSHDKLQSLVDQHNELTQNKPLLFGKKAWETQRDEIYQEHKKLKGQHEHQKKHGVKDLLDNEKFKEHAWKQYQQQHPAKAKQYQTLYPSYQVIKKCVDEIKAEQQMKLRQEQQLKAQQHVPKMKSRGMSR